MVCVWNYESLIKFASSRFAVKLCVGDDRILLDHVKIGLPDSLARSFAKRAIGRKFALRKIQYNQIPAKARNSLHVARAMGRKEDIYEFLYGRDIVFRCSPEQVGEISLLTRSINLVTDWIVELDIRDPKLFSKLHRLSFSQILEHSERWHEKLKRDAEKLRERGLPRDDEGAPTVLEITEGEYAGWRWIWLKSNEARDLEGQVMGHCVGGGAYDRLEPHEAIFSLRDFNNRSHVTMYLSDGGIQQAVTRGNSALGGYAKAVVRAANALQPRLLDASDLSSAILNVNAGCAV